MKWKACELHTHTVHSDGSFTVDTLAARAKLLGIEAVALTDHNAIAGYQELGRHEEYIIRGLELTTYHGHILTHGCKEYVEWYDTDLERIEDKLDEVHAKGGVAGMAHPFCPGTPICSGCHWDYPVHDYGKLDFIEIWSRSTPPRMTYNRKAMQLWMDRLSDGFRITGTSARDWHGYESDDEPFAVTYLQMGEGDVTGEAVRALRSGRAYVTMGPELTLTARQGARRFGIGDTMRRGGAQIEMTVREGARKAVWEKFGIEPVRLELVTAAGKQVAALPFRGYGVTETLELKAAVPWLLAILRGTVNGAPCELAITNPIYCE